MPFLMGSGAVGEIKAAKWVGVGMEALPEQCGLFQACCLRRSAKGLFIVRSEGKQEELLENVLQFENCSIFHS